MLEEVITSAGLMACEKVVEDISRTAAALEMLQDVLESSRHEIEEDDWEAVTVVEDDFAFEADNLIDLDNAIEEDPGMNEGVITINEDIDIEDFVEIVPPPPEEDALFSWMILESDLESSEQLDEDQLAEISGWSNSSGERQLHGVV